MISVTFGYGIGSITTFGWGTPLFPKADGGFGGVPCLVASKNLTPILSTNSLVPELKIKNEKKCGC